MPNPLLLRMALWTGVLGFIASLFAHLATFTDYTLPDSVTVLHVGVFVAFLPIVFAMSKWAELRGLNLSNFRDQWTVQRELVGLLSGWQKAMLGLLLVYTAVNFGMGLAEMMSNADEFPTRLFSGHWLFFYFASAVFAHRFLKLSHRFVP